MKGLQPWCLHPGGSEELLVVPVGWARKVGDLDEGRGR